ncbi:MAG: PAAR domain-containing protein [Deltaproteobacteria bacterium]|nr:PAAR domain-containing protein [Deltaproteobacteria bacterium]MCB9786329.1 PAAR domain-containing protein [Deltaproteobacteria bacterium]
MPEQVRIGDLGKCDACAHGCPSCPHPTIGPLIAGSADVFVNKLPAGRLNDPGVHAACCNANMWNTAKGSGTVFINGKAAVRKGDATKHCGGSGKMTMGSADVFTGG